MAGQEPAIIDSIVADLEATFAGTGIIFTTVEPTDGIEHSTIYIGGDDSAFEEYGSFLGLAEQVDVSNRDPSDSGFVFTDGCDAVDDSDSHARAVAGTAAHETAHLLGYVHAKHTEETGPLSHVAANGIATIEFVSAPSVVGQGERVNINVRMKLSGNTNGGPWLVEELGLYDSDSPTGGYIPWTTIEFVSDEFYITNQNVWVPYTFFNVDLSARADLFDFSDGVELYAEVEINSNNFFGTNIQDQTPIKIVIIDDKGPEEPNADLNASSDTGYSSTDNITRDSTPTFSWSVPNDRYGSRVVQYRFEVGDSRPDKYTTTSTTITYPESLPNGTHRFYVQAKDEWGNWGDIDDDLSFTIDTSAPGRPSLDLRSSSDSGTSRSDNLTNDRTPTINFSASGNPYRFWYDVDDSSPDRGPTTGSSWTTHTLSNGNRVIYAQAEDTAGNKSSVGQLTITIDSSAPTTPSLQQPSNNASVTESPVDFDWSGGSDSHFDKYELWVDDNSSFSSPTKKSTGNSFYNNLSLGTGRWYWKVLAFDKAGNSSVSATRQFDRVSPRVTDLSFRNGTSSGASEIGSIYASNTVYLRVDAVGMNGRTINVELWEDDGFGDDKITTKSIPINSQGYGTASWTATWQGDDAVDPFNRYYLFYDKPFSLDNTYSGAPNAGHFLVRPPQDDTIVGRAWTINPLTFPQQIPEFVIPVVLDRFDSDDPIDATKTTWVVIHGRTDSFVPSELDNPRPMWELAQAIDDSTRMDQVLTLDWRDGADAPGGFLDFVGEKWIVPVAQWASNVLRDYGFAISNVSLIGHSWGAVLAAELADAVVGNVNRIVALDPAQDPNSIPLLVGDPSYDSDSVDFRANANHSWAFLTSQAGSGTSVPTADDSFLLDIFAEGQRDDLLSDGVNWSATASHGYARDMFTAMLNSNDEMSRLFRLDRVNANSPIWSPNEYFVDPVFGFANRIGLIKRYEGILGFEERNGMLTPVDFKYVNELGEERTIRESNTAPTISDIADRTINEDGDTGPIAFTVNDAETPAGSLALSKQSSNTTIVPLNNIVLGGSGVNRTVTVTPTANQNGPVTITLTVTDSGGLTHSESFVVTVNPVNDPPSFTRGSDVDVDENSGVYSVSWATNISTGPGNESDQTAIFEILSNDNPALFSTAPEISTSGTLTFTPASDLNGVANLEIRLRDNGGIANGGNNTSPSQSLRITVDDDLPALNISVSPNSFSEDAGSNAAEGRVSRTGPTTSPLMVSLSSNDRSEATVPSMVTIDAGQNRSAPFSLSAVNDDVDDDAQSVTITASANGYSSGNAQLVVTDDDTAGITVNPTSGLRTTEAGGMATFTVVLDSQPTANVTIALSSSDTTEGTVSDASLTFLPGDWDTPQEVTITGEPDDLPDGDIAYTIVTAAVSSADPKYDGMNPADVSVTNEDGDAPPTSSTFSVPFSPTSPTIDGVFSADEWGPGYDVTFERRDDGRQHDSTLYFRHDDSSLYVGVDSQWGSGWDVVWDIFVDGDHNGELNGNLDPPYIDVNSSRPSPTGWSGYTHYRTLPSVDTAVNVGFGTGAASASGGSANVFYEYKIPFADLNVSSGDSIGFYISHGYDGVTDHRYELSTGQSRQTPEIWDTLKLQPTPSAFSVPFSPTSPTIDGVFSADEWGPGYDVTFERRDDGRQHDSTLYFRHDGSSLYVGVDSQWGSGWDVVWDIFVDGDHNGEMNGNLDPPYIDVISSRPSPTGWPGYTSYRTRPSLDTEVIVGFGTGAASASGGSENVFYEYKIPFADLNVSSGDSIGFYISHGYDGVTEHRYELSTGQSRQTPEIWDTLKLQPVADLTGNGFVDFEDLTVLLAAWNQNVSAAEGNLVDPDGSPVNFEDLTVLLAAWTGPGAAGAPVGRRLAAARETVGGDFVGDVVGDGPWVAVGDASYRRRDESPRQAAAYDAVMLKHNLRGAQRAARFRSAGGTFGRLQAAAVDRVLEVEGDEGVIRSRAVAHRARR